MRQDWIEFEGQNWGKFIVRPEYISWVSTHKEFSTEENKDIYYTNIHVDDGSVYGEIMWTREPYEQVKQKIMDAEKVDLNDAVVERFTKKEYEVIRNVFVSGKKACGEKYTFGPISTSILEKLNKILEEME